MRRIWKEDDENEEEGTVNVRKVKKTGGWNLKWTKRLILFAKAFAAKSLEQLEDGLQAF